MAEVACLARGQLRDTFSLICTHLPGTRVKLDHVEILWLSMQEYYRLKGGHLLEPCTCRPRAHVAGACPGARGSASGARDDDDRRLACLNEQCIATLKKWDKRARSARFRRGPDIRLFQRAL